MSGAIKGVQKHRFQIPTRFVSKSTADYILIITLRRSVIMSRSQELHSGYCAQKKKAYALLRCMTLFLESIHKIRHLPFSYFLSSSGLVQPRVCFPLTRINTVMHANVSASDQTRQPYSHIFTLQQPAGCVYFSYCLGFNHNKK